MSQVKITNGTVDTYPYSVGQLRRDNPKTSFPKRIPDEMLAEWGVYPVAFGDAPEIDNRTQIAEQETQPVLMGSVWSLGWVVLDKSAEDVQQYDANVAEAARNKRNQLLSGSDWTQVADAPVNATAWATYRQALRDVTTQEGFPHNVTWPTKPE